VCINRTTYKPIYYWLPPVVWTQRMMKVSRWGWDYVSELLPPCLLFIPQVIWELEPWCNDIDRRNILIRRRELFGNPTSSHLVAKQEELTKEIMNFVLRVSLSYFEGFFGRTIPHRANGVGLLSAQAWMPAYASILRSPRQSLDLIKYSWFPYQV
jgi:hypothetical protein